jgi:hypothetical protein
MRNVAVLRVWMRYRADLYLETGITLVRFRLVIPKPISTHLLALFSTFIKAGKCGNVLFGLMNIVSYD